MNAALSSLETFRAQGIPHRRMEDWKYSDLRSVLDSSAFENSFGVTITLVDQSADIETIVNDLLPVWALERAANPAAGGTMDAAARAFQPSTIAIRVPRGVHVAQPLRIDFSGAGNGYVLLLLERGSSLTLTEIHRAGANGLRNISFSIALEEGAKLTHVRRELCAPELVAVETIGIEVGRNARYRAHFATQGAKLSRAELNIALVGDEAEIDLSGVSVLGDGLHADVTTHVDHKIGHTRSAQLVKSVAGGKSRGVYQGKITVREGADGSDSRQTAKGLLLGARAEIDLKPELEILADDVKCAHGAAIGDLDAESIFYLRSRGIPEEEARALLIRAFLEEAVEGIEREDIREAMWHFVEEGLARATECAP
jgi:Fe-S cluster assembly protein SufD